MDNGLWLLAGIVFVGSVMEFNKGAWQEPRKRYMLLGIIGFTMIALYSGQN